MPVGQSVGLGLLSPWWRMEISLAFHCAFGLWVEESEVIPSLLCFDAAPGLAMSNARQMLSSAHQASLVDAQVFFP